MDRWREAHGEIDILVHAVAHARREDLEGSFVDTSREGYLFAVEVSAYSLVAHDASRPAAPPPRAARSSP